jgi:ubiquinone biosynthesis protein COQ4
MKNLALKQQSQCTVCEGTKGFVQFVRDPRRLETVFQIADKLIPMSHRERSAKKMRALSSTADLAFANKVRITPIRLEDFRQYPEGTLGHAYYNFMMEQNLSPDSIPRLADNTDANYYMATSYETHDIWHVVTGFDTNVAGELGLQAFYTAQNPVGLSEVILLGGFLNALLFKQTDLIYRIREFRRGRRMGKAAQNLVGVNWDLYWNMPLAEVREKFKVVD